MPRIFISTAEPSAELHASHVVNALKRMTPEIMVDVAGTQVLAATGATVVVDMSGQAVMGFWEALSHLSFYRHAENSILNALASNSYDALVVVDAPSFHLHLAKKVHARFPHLPILYYIAPKLWAWKQWRIKNLRRDIAKTLCIFPFEEEFFKSRGVNAVYAGNPTLDQIRHLDGKVLAERFGVSGTTRHNEPERGLLAVFPGSRKLEVEQLWPEMAKALHILQKRFPHLKAAVAIAPGWSEEELRLVAEPPKGVAFVVGGSQELLAASSAVIAKSGTTTLEAGLMGKPMVVCYRTHPITYHIAKSLVKIRFVSLPNILSGKPIVKELLQDNATAEKLAKEMERILADRRYYRKMRTQLMALRETLGDEPGASRAAREIAAYFDKDRST